jgi:threonine/homoserine/homoserine lactone efflux protein
MNEIIISGIVLGASAGFAPGPLMTLVLLQTLQHGTKEGCKTALVPLLTDLPVILLSLFLITRVAGLNTFLGIISLAGGGFVLYLARQSFRAPKLATEGAVTEPRSLRKGFLINILSPNPWIFWFTVGAATFSKALALGWQAAVVFLLIFYVMLCGIKSSIALVAGTSRAFLTGRAYRIILGGLGVALVVFAGFLFRDAARFFSLIH